MSTDLAELEGWFADRPHWLQDAARRLFEAGGLTADDLKELLVLCKRQAGIIVPEYPDLAFRPIPAKAFVTTEVVAALRLDTIADVKGINALGPRNPLQLNKNQCTIIYGHNGSGKSGYIRVLKHICGGKGPRPLHRNVFDSALSEQGCTIHYTLNDDGHKLAWTPSAGLQQQLRHVALYDSDCAHVYLNNENEVAYEPVLLGHFRKLVEACVALDASITAELQQNTSSKPLLPPEFASTTSGQWFNTLSHTTDPKTVDACCEWTVELEQELQKLIQRLAEPNPATKAAAIRKTKVHLVDFRETLNKLTSQLNDEAFAAMTSRREFARQKRQAADIDAKSVFENAPLTGVASESWHLLWKAAREYSVTEAYKDNGFPVTGENARCVLCQQSLDANAKQRLSAFEDYVNSTLQADARESEALLEGHLKSIKEIPSADDFDKLSDLAGISDDHLRERLHSYRLNLTSRRAMLLAESSAVQDMPVLAAAVLEVLREQELAYEKAIADFDEDAKADSKPGLLVKRPS